MTLRVVSAAAKTRRQTVTITSLPFILLLSLVPALHPLSFSFFFLGRRSQKKNGGLSSSSGPDGPTRSRRQAAIAAGLCVSVASTVQALRGLVPALEPTLAGVGTTLANLCPRPADWFLTLSPGKGCEPGAPDSCAHVVARLSALALFPPFLILASPALLVLAGWTKVFGDPPRRVACAQELWDCICVWCF